MVIYLSYIIYIIKYYYITKKFKKIKHLYANMNRKLVKQGNNALTLSLPCKWIEKRELKKGDYVDVIDFGRDLLITSSNTKSHKKKYEIQVTKENPFFKRYLRSCYILGYDEVNIRSLENLPYGLIKESISNLLGYELIEQESKRCTIGLISELSNEKVDVLIRKLFFMIQTMFDDIIKLIKNKKIEEISGVAEVEASVNSFVDFCLRVLNKYGHEDFSKTQYYYNVLILLEQIADSLRDYSLNFVKDSEVTLSSLMQLRDYFIKITKLYLKYKMNEISVIKNYRIALYKKIRLECNNAPLQYLDLYSILNFLHQFEVVIDPIKN